MIAVERKNESSASTFGGLTNFFQSSTVRTILTATTVSAVAVASLYAYRFARRRMTKYGVEKMALRKMISEKYSSSRDIVKFNIKKAQTIVDNSTSFVFNVVDHLDKKPALALNKTSNPFVPPFVEDLYITDVSNDHRLILNKFSVAKEHCLVITKSLQKQNEQLRASDLAASYKVATSLNGFAFYNSGPESGCSVMHRHIQVMPLEHFSNSALVEEYDSLVANVPVGKAIKVPTFKNIRHVLMKVPTFEEGDTYESYGEKLHDVYKQALEVVGNENNSHSYNCVFNENWMLVVLRSKEIAANVMSINSTGFLGSFLLKNEDMMEKLKMNPISLLEDIAIPEYTPEQQTLHTLTK